MFQQKQHRAVPDCEETSLQRSLIYDIVGRADERTLWWVLIVKLSMRYESRNGSLGRLHYVQLERYVIPKDPEAWSSAYVCVNRIILK